ncbi:hypothetical protein ACA910_010922 [Epithemia clementina (nom. ined.)]
MAVHMMEKGQPSSAVQLMKDSLRVNYGMYYETTAASSDTSTATDNNTNNKAQKTSHPRDVASDPNNMDSLPNKTTSKDEDDKLILVVNSMIRNSILCSTSDPSNPQTYFSSSPSSDEQQQQQEEEPQQQRHEPQQRHRFPFQVNAVEYGDLESMMSAIDPNVPCRELIFHPVYVRDANMENLRLSSVPPTVEEEGKGNTAERKLCGILFYNLGIACFLEHVIASDPSRYNNAAVSTIPPVLIGNHLIQLDHQCQANLALEMSHLIFTSLLRRSNSLSDDLCLTLISVMSLSLIHRFQNNTDYRTVLGTYQTISEVWDAMHRDVVTTTFTSSRGKIAPAG